MAILLLSSACKDVITYGHYIINKAQIIADHCININKPALQCGGKCYLMQSISENQEQENLPNTPIEKLVKLVYIQPPLLQDNPPTRAILTQDQIAWKCRYFTSFYLDKIFHPPWKATYSIVIV